MVQARLQDTRLTVEVERGPQGGASDTHIRLASILKVRLAIYPHVYKHIQDIINLSYT